MASTVTSRDVQEIVFKLSSDKAKAREEGIKLLNTWLEGEKSIVFCKYVSEKTALLGPHDIPHSETWPFIISLLIQCVTLEISSSKKRLPKLSFAKTLRIVVQRAEDTKFSGKNLLLLPVAKILFNHIWDVLKEISSFQSEYAIILRHLLGAQNYRFHMRKRVYCGLVLLYIEKVQKHLDTKSGLSNPKEEVFRCILTLHSLLENPPGDFPDGLQDEIVNGFIRIFTHIRDDGKISRKLIECINTYLSKHGPNVGSKALEIHEAVQQFVFRCWITTHDRSLKDALFLYARLQLNLTRGADDGGALLEQLLEILSKELDHMSTSSTTLPWNETTRDDKCGTLTSSQHGLLELAALVFCRACTNISKAPSAEKRARREHAVDQIKDGLMKGKWSWHAAFCYLIRNYYTRIRKALLTYWFESISASFETIINNANVEHAYDGLLWTLRSLQVLSPLLRFPASGVDVLPNSSFAMNEFDKGWQMIWRCVIRSLPILSNVTPIVDAALLLVSSIILSDSLSIITVSQDIWNLRLFKCLPSASVLHFISCYFSRRASQGDLRDALHLRQNLLRSVLVLLNWKESFILNEQLVVLLPLTIYALCSGCASLPLHVPETAENWVKAEEHDHQSVHEFFELSVEMLAKIDDKPAPKVMQTEWCQGVHLPRKLRCLLFHEVESHILETIKEREIRTMLLPDIFFACALLSNLMYCSYSMSFRLREDYSLFISKLGYYMIELMDHAALIMEKTHNDIKFGCLGSNSIFNSMGSVVASIKSFFGSPLFSKWGKDKGIDGVLHTTITHSIERLLKGVAKLFEGCSDYGRDLHSGVDLPDIFDRKNSRDSYPSDNSKNTIVDMELDVSSGSKDVDILTLGGKIANGFAVSSVHLKMEIVSFISTFFSVLPSMTWDILFDLAGKESNPSVLEALLFSLCQHPEWSSDRRLLDLVTFLNEVVDMQANLKLQSLNTLDAISGLVQSLLCLTGTAKDKHVASSSKGIASEEEVTTLGDLVNKVAENNLFDWHGRSKLVDCICNFVLLKPEVGQLMIEKLLMMLRDPDYRVRFTLARRISVLFRTWDGHHELLQDICSSFGAKLVVFSKEKVVTANEVLSAGPQARPSLETAIITLMHLALESEKIELEAVFMICAVAAIDPCQRELVGAVLDNLSRELQYCSREKYMEELIGPILFCWVACGVSLAALVETRGLFVASMEPINFMQYCCHWLLPALLLNEDSSNLNWVAKLASQPPATLVKSHFVHIFSVCMALHCSKKAGSQKGLAVLESSILSIAEISENERDKLIKKHMVSIVNHLFSLAAASTDPALPLFSRDTIMHAIQTVVDGFLEMSREEHPGSTGLVDKINIFRPDRVFMFIIEMHYKITAAANHRHKCNRLAGVEVLIDLLGHRAGVSSTSNYLLNLVGQCIGRHALLDQCCRIISKLLKICKSCPAEDTSRVLGEQLPFLVSKLVPCCMLSESDGELSVASSCEVLSLLHQLIVHSDPSFYEYIKELELFPQLEPFDDIRGFQKKLCLDYSPRNHLINLAKRSYYLSPRTLMLSLKALHRKFFGVETCLGETNAKLDLGDKHWHSDQNIVRAIWNLVQTCSLDDTSGFATLVSDFVSKIGIGDPHRVVFDLPGEFSYMPGSRVHKATAIEMDFYMDTDTSEELLYSLVRLLKKYLMDDSVKIIDIAAQALRGILSTEKGQRALLSFDSYERSLIEVHSKGVNMDLVQKLVLDLERKFNDEAISLWNSTIWKTSGKTFEMWICPLVYALIGYCDDIIIRLCQDIVLVKSEVAELLLSNVIVNLAGGKDLDVDLCKLISLQVQENIFTESNALMKSIKVILDALNELRLCHVLERATTSSALHMRESLKNAKPSSYGAKSRSVSAKHKDHFNSSRLESSTLLWEKVYWLPIDYLVVAKSAINCGSYFTAVMYVEHWCEEHFNSLTLGSPDFSHLEVLPPHIEILVSAVTQINEPDSLYGIIQSHKLTSQIIMFEHEGNWTKALEHYDLLLRSGEMEQKNANSRTLSSEESESLVPAPFCISENEMSQKKPFKGLIRSLQQIGCTHVLDIYCQGLASQKSQLQHDLEFTELQYEAAWRAGDWDFSLLYGDSNSAILNQCPRAGHFNENLHSCFRALEEGDLDEFHTKVRGSKQELLLCICNASKESTEYIYSTIAKLQIFHHLGMAWELRWSSIARKMDSSSELEKKSSKPTIPSMQQLSWLSKDWNRILEQAQLHMNLLEPFIAFRRVLLQILNNTDSKMQHLLDSASTLRKGSRFSQAVASLHEFKSICTGMGEDCSNFYWRGRLEEAKLLRAQGQHEMAINLAKYISQNLQLNTDASDVFRLLGKWLAETRSSNSRIVLEKYLKHAVEIADNLKDKDTHSTLKQCQMHFHLAHYADALFRSYEDRLNSSEWQAAMRLRKLKTKELEALIRRLKSSSKGEQIEYSLKIKELQPQLTMDKEEAEKLQEDRDNFLTTALEGYKHCLVIGDKYDVRVVFRLVSLWFGLSSRPIVVNAMLSSIKQVQSYKFIPLVYQIASRMGGTKDGQGPHSFQFALISLVKKMATEHPYHTIFQLLALENGDRIKDKQRSRKSFVADTDKKVAAKNLLKELYSYHGDVIRQMKQMVEIYIKLAELETKREDTNRKVTLPRDIRGVRELELAPVVTSNFPVDRSCQYLGGSFPHFKGLADSVTVMNGINAPKVVECLGSDGKIYRQLAKSGNDDLRQDAVMEQFFALVNTFLQNHRDTRKRRLRIRTYKVVPFTPSAGVLEWVDGTVPLGEYLTGSTRNGGAHRRYGVGDWMFSKCRQHMATESDKRKAFEEVCEHFRPVMHYFFLERFLHPSDWFEKRLAYARSVAASSMVGYIVGLGDRHAMNILIDQATAEVVHIDLGVAFEQGLMLKTPERVPFRLTRDIVDGMGITGVEGVFRRCCEETLSVMRTNKEALLTIVEVFIHDPLYKWALSPLKALQRQKETDYELDTSLEDSEDEYEGNKDAARALMRVKQKLDGYEDGEMRSAHGQVQQLIQDAIDPDRLCQLFPGWAAWM